MINLELPKKFKPLVEQAHQVAENFFRPISRKYDLAEHEYPTELDMLAALMDGMNDGGGGAGGVAQASFRRPMRRRRKTRARAMAPIWRRCLD